MYQYKLRPHHIKSLINFYNKRLYLLSEDEYVKRFQEKNKGYHNDIFVIFWRRFLVKILENKDYNILYENSFDNICEKCDIFKECSDKNSNLRKLVDKLDNDFLKYSDLKEWKIYSIREILKKS